MGEKKATLKRKSIGPPGLPPLVPLRYCFFLPWRLVPGEVLDGERRHVHHLHGHVLGAGGQRRAGAVAVLRGREEEAISMKGARVQRSQAVRVCVCVASTQVKI